MNWLKNLFTVSVDKVVDSLGAAIDRNVTSDHERLAMANELLKIKEAAKIESDKNAREAEARLESEITKRWEADMGQDDTLAKRVRPISLLYLLIFMSVVIVADSSGGLDFEVKKAYIELLEALLMLVFFAYFGSRGIEKIQSIRSKWRK